MINSAFSSRRLSRRLSRSSRSTSPAGGLAQRGLGPRGFGASPQATPAANCRRQPVSVELYSPSRLSNAPSSPGLRQRLASSRIRRLYPVLKLRRTGRFDTSGSGNLPPPPPTPLDSVPFCGVEAASTSPLHSSSVFMTLPRPQLCTLNSTQPVVSPFIDT